MRTATRILSGVLAMGLLSGPPSARAQSVSLAPVSPAPASVAPAVARLGDDLHLYFQGEKREGIAFMSIGVPAVILGGSLLAQDGELGRGLGYPMLAIGVIELLAGVIVYTRTDRQVARLDAGLRQSPQATRDSELKRMRRVNREFVLLKWVESSLLLSGLVMAAAGVGTRHEALGGAGLGLALQSAAMLAFDGFAALRAQSYTSSLERFQLSAGLAPSIPTAGGGGASWGFRLAARLCY